MNDPAPSREAAPVAIGAIVLLGCRVEALGRLRGASARRAARAARAFHEGAAPIVIASGGVRWNGVAEADALCSELLLEGVPRDAIVLERQSASTRQNARFVARLIEERKVELLEVMALRPRVALVTCDWHMPRALRCFRSVGLDAVGLPAPSPKVGVLRRLVRRAREAASYWADGVIFGGPDHR